MRTINLALFILFLCLAARTLHGRPPAPPPSPPPSAPAPPNVQQQVPDLESAWRVEGTWQSTSEEAWQAVLSQAQAEIMQRLRQQGLAMNWKPSRDYIRARMVSNWHEETRDFNEADVRLMHRIILDVQVSPSVQAEIKQHDRQELGQERMAWLAKLLVGVVVLLAGVAGYFFLDDWTKGYYTTWLRLGAGAIGVAAVAVMLL